MVENKKTRVLSAAKILKIKDSTAKMIIKKYRERNEINDHKVVKEEKSSESTPKSLEKEIPAIKI